MVKKKRCLTFRTERNKKREKDRSRRLSRRTRRNNAQIAVFKDQRSRLEALSKSMSSRKDNPLADAVSAADMEAKTVPDSVICSELVVCSPNSVVKSKADDAQNEPSIGAMDRYPSTPGCSPAGSRPGTPSQQPVHGPRLVVARGQSRQPTQTKYSRLLAVIGGMRHHVRPTYSGSKSTAERLKREIGQARILVRECLMETERGTAS